MTFADADVWADTFWPVQFAQAQNELGVEPNARGNNQW